MICPEDNVVEALGWRWPDTFSRFPTETYRSLSPFVFTWYPRRTGISLLVSYCFHYFQFDLTTDFNVVPD